MKIRIFLPLFFIASAIVYGQQSLVDSIKNSLPSLSEKDQVDLIIDQVWRVSSQNIEEGKNLALQAIAISQKNGWKRKEIDAKAELAGPLYRLGEYEEVYKLEREKLNFCDSIGDQACIGNHLNYMANSIKRIGEFKKAHAYLDRALEVCTAINDSLCLSTNHDHRGVIYMEEKKYDDALREFLLTLKIREQINDSVGIGYVCNNLSWVYTHFEEYEKALSMMERARAIRENLNDKTGLAVCVNNIGEVYFQMGEYGKAIKYFEEALQQSQALNFTDLTRHIFEFTSQAYMKIGEFEKAHTYLKSSYELKDSLLNANKTKALLELETKYETDNKQRQLEIEQARNQNLRAIAIGGFAALILLTVVGFLINKNNQQQQLREQERQHEKSMLKAILSATEEERSRIAKDLHDGIGQQLSALRLGWQHISESLKSVLPAEENKMRKLNSILSGAAEDVRALSHRMMPRSLGELGLEAAIGDMLDKSFTPSDIHYEFDTFGMNNRLPEAIEIGLYRIAQELVNNILKHANATEVNVQLSRNRNGLVLRVEDNGKGFDFKKANKIGKGLMSLESRASAMNGILRWENSEPGGTTAVVRVPEVNVEAV